MIRRRTAREQRIWNDGYATGYKAAHIRLQVEIRDEYAGKLARVRGRVNSILGLEIPQAPAMTSLPIARFTTLCGACPRVIHPGQAFVTYLGKATHPGCVPKICTRCSMEISKAGTCGCYDERPLLRTPS